MADDEFEKLSRALGFTELSEEKLLEHFQNQLEQLTKMFVHAGVDGVEAREMALKVLSGDLSYGSGRGGMHPKDFEDVVEHALFRQNLRRIVLDISLEADEYHIAMKVLAVDPEAAEQLETVAKKLHARKRTGEPS